MRKLRCFQVAGISVQEVLDEFNERSSEFGVQEEGIVSVSALPLTREVKVHTGNGMKDASIEVLIVYWADE